MRHLQFVVMTVALLLVLSACAAETPPQAAPVSQPASEPQEDMESDEGPQKVFDDFDPGNFTRSATIDNPYLPLQPGTQWIYEGTTVEEGESLAHRIEFTITDLTKEINGVRTVVVWIVDISDDEIAEKEIAFYAQDNDGTVWFGEHPEEYEDGEFTEAPTWIAGLDGARLGIKMWALPQLGMPSYFQG